MSATVLLAGFAETAAHEIAAAWRRLPGLPAGETPRAAGLDETFAALAAPETAGAVFCFGPALAGRELAHRLRRHAAALSLNRALLLGAGAELELFADLVEADLLFYLSPRPPAPGETAALLAAAAREAGALGDETAKPAAESAAVLRRVLEIERSRGLEETVASLEAAARKLVPARRAALRWHDAATSTLWSPAGESAEAARDSVATGLTGFVARTGRPVLSPRIGEDPRYDPEPDNGGRSRRERFLAVALPAGPAAGDEAAVEAVLTLARGAEQPPFGAGELALAAALGREAGPILRRRRIAAELARIESATAVFRREALDHYEKGPRPRQEPLRLAPSWLGAAYRSLLLLSLLAALVLLAAGGRLGSWLDGIAP